MIIMGIDPGSRITGYGIIESYFSKQRYIASGSIQLGADQFALRLARLHDALQTLIARYAPEQVAMEQVFLKRNPSVAIKLGQARGAAMSVIGIHAIDMAEYTPREVKKAVVGYGNATKTQVQDMVVRLLQLNKAPKVDAADALAVALCHHFTDRGLRGMQGIIR